MTTSAIQFSFTQGPDRLGAPAGRSASSGATSFEASPDAFARALQGRLNDGGSAGTPDGRPRTDGPAERPRTAERSPERPREAAAREPAAQAGRPPEPSRGQPAQDGEKASTAAEPEEARAESASGAGRDAASAADADTASAGTNATPMPGGADPLDAPPLDAALADAQANTGAEEVGNAEAAVAGLPAAIAALLAAARASAAEPASDAEALPVSGNPAGAAALTDGPLPATDAKPPASVSAEAGKAAKGAAAAGEAGAVHLGTDPAALRPGPQQAMPAASEPALPGADGAPNPQPAQALLPAEGGAVGAHGVNVFAALRHAAAAPPATPQLPVHTPAGQPAWAEDVGTQVHWMLGRAESRAELVLTPASLGKLEVSINLNGDQTTAQFVAATPAARDALEQALPRLREILQQAGINLGEANVSTSGEQGARDDGGQGRRGTGRGGEAGLGATAGGTAAWSRAHEGMVDTFA